MDEVYLINKLRASFLKNSDEISNIRVLTPYKIDENGNNDDQRYSALSSLYVDENTGKDYLKIIKSPPINDDYFLVIAENSHGKKNNKHKDTDLLQHLSLDIYNNNGNNDSYANQYENSLTNPNFIKNTNAFIANELTPEASILSGNEDDLVKFADDENSLTNIKNTISNGDNKTSHSLASNIKKKVSRRISSASSMANNELHSINSKLSKGNSRLRLSKISNLFHKSPKMHIHNDSDKLSIFTNDDLISNGSSRRLFQTRSKSASFYGDDLASIASSRNGSLSRRSSEILRKGVSFLYKKKYSGDIPEESSSSKKKNYFSRHFFRSKSDNSLHNGKKADMTRSTSNMFLENMMYTDQLFRDGEIPENFEEDDDDDDDDEEEEEDDDDKEDNHDKYEDNSGFKQGDVFAKSHESDNETINSSKMSNYKKMSSFTKDFSRKNQTGSSISLSNNESNSATHEDHIFNFKKISKKFLPSNNNNNEITVEKKNSINNNSSSNNNNNRSSSVILDHSYRENNEPKMSEQTSTAEDASKKANLAKSNKDTKEAPYPDLMELGSFIEDNNDLNSMLELNYNTPSVQEIRGVEIANSNLKNHTVNSAFTLSTNKNSKSIDASSKSNDSNQITGVNERYYGDLASSFGESLIDSDFEFEKDHIDNSIPSHSDFIENNVANDMNGSDDKLKLSDTETDGNLNVEEDLFKKIDFSESPEERNLLKPSKLTPLLHKSKTNANSSQNNYESILASGDDGMEISCYLNGNPKPIQLNISKIQKVTNFQLLQLILFRFDKVDDIDEYILRIVDEDGLPFEGDFGILSREGIVERNLMMEELVACKTDDPAIIRNNKIEREKIESTITSSNYNNKNNGDSSSNIQNNTITISVYGKPNTASVNIDHLDSVGELVSRYCLQRDLDPKKYYLKFKDDNFYLDKDEMLADVLNQKDKTLQVITVKESRQLNFRKLKHLKKHIDLDEDIDEEMENEEYSYSQKDDTHTMAPFTLKNDGKFLPIGVSTKQTKKVSQASTKTKNKKQENKQDTTIQEPINNTTLFNSAFDNRNNNYGMNGLPLNLTEVYYKYTVFRRQHQKVSLLNNKQLKTLAIDGDFIYLVDNDTAPGLLNNGSDNQTTNNGTHWYDQQHYQNGSNYHYNSQSRTKTFHISQLIKIEKSNKNKLHFKIKFIRVHGPKSYYFEALTSADREEIVYKLSTLKSIYNRNK